jgi:DNA-binding MarR family transcriptional regulator
MSDEHAEAIDLIRRVNRFIRAGDLDDATLGELTMAQVRVLFRLRNHGPMTSGGLASKLGVTLPTVTSVVDRLVGHGLVERRDDPDDRRRVIVALSSDGGALVERIQQGRRARLAAAVEALDPAQRRCLIDGLTFLVAATERVDLTELREAISNNG